VLLRQAERAAEPDGDVNDLLMSVFYLLHHKQITRLNAAMAARSHQFGRIRRAAAVTPNTVGGEPL
jgi:hypothetical protein